MHGSQKDGVQAEYPPKLNTDELIPLVPIYAANTTNLMVEDVVTQ